MQCEGVTKKKLTRENGLRYIIKICFVVCGIYD